MVVRRQRSVASSDEVWRVVSDPERLSQWWPGVVRVEEATPDTWTTVFTGQGQERAGRLHARGGRAAAGSSGARS